jgi:peptidoglycan/LPS O-acetylase OafA/YrhL
MRALAVLVVLLFHVDIPGFAGGFLGVDLFFVISGFIITRNILFDVHSGKFSLKEFYIRRFRRLFPALLTTVLCTLVAAVVVLPPLELEALGKSSVFALFSLANFNFWLESGYFDASAYTKPLLHTWSLSVEEQFYLFWPALLLVFKSTRPRLIFTVCLLAASLVCAYLLRNSMPDGIFYLLPFRLHQLMAGALIAILALQLTGAAGNVGLALATAGFVGLTLTANGSESPLTGAAGVSLLGFLLLLGRETYLAQRLFGNQPMQWIGQRSYALYLVHWPIVVLFGFLTDFDLNPAEQCLLLFLSFATAAALHRFVEQPFRKRGQDITRAQRMAVSVTVSVLLVTLVLASAFWYMQGLPSRIDAQIRQVVDSLDAERELRKKAIRFGQCNLHMGFDFSDYDPAVCARLDPDRPNVLIIGDSLAADTYMMLSQVYPEIHFLQATAGACTAVLELTKVGERYPTCEHLNQYRFSTLASLDTDLVILSSIWEADRIEPLKQTIEHLHSLGRKVLVMGPRAVFHGSIPLLISEQPSLDVVNQNLGSHIVQKTELLQQMRTALPGVEVVDIGSMQCGKMCEVVEGDRLLYFDAQHFTRLGARKTGERFRQAFDLPGFINAPQSADH